MIEFEYEGGNCRTAILNPIEITLGVFRVHAISYGDFVVKIPKSIEILYDSSEGDYEIESEFFNCPPDPDDIANSILSDAEYKEWEPYNEGLLFIPVWNYREGFRKLRRFMWQRKRKRRMGK